jgi:hypothetical protein
MDALPDAAPPPGMVSPSAKAAAPAATPGGFSTSYFPGSKTSGYTDASGKTVVGYVPSGSGADSGAPSLSPPTGAPQSAQSDALPTPPIPPASPPPMQASGASSPVVSSRDDTSGSAPAPGAPGKDTSWMDALPEVAPPPGMKAAQQPVSATSQNQGSGADAAQQPQKPMGWADIPKVFTGSMGAFMDAIPRGIVGDKVVSGVNAAMQTPFHMIGGLQGPVSAYNEAYNQDRQQTEGLSNAYPMAHLAGGLGGAFVGGAAMGPSLGLRAATGILPKIGAIGSQLARNSAFGGTMAAANGEDPLMGAGLGAAGPVLGLAGGAALRPFKSVYNKLSPLVSSGGRETSVGNKLATDFGSGPTQIQSSPVGPLDLAQATGNAKIAGQVQVAKPYADEAEKNLRAAQQQSISNQIGKIGTPSSAPDAAIETTEAVQKAQGAAKNYTRSLWNAPELQSTPVPTSAIKALMDHAVATMPKGINMGVTGGIKKALDQLHSMGDHETVGTMNSIRTALRLASKPSEQNPWAQLAGGQLGRTFDDAVERTVKAPSLAQPGVGPAWTAAKNATRQMKEAFGAEKIKPMTNPDKAASEMGAKPFNFSKGLPEGAEALSNLSKYMSSIPGGKPLASNIIEGARSQIVAAMQEAADSKGGTASLQAFLKTNSAWLKSTGVLDAPQIHALDELSEYTNMLRKPDEMLAARGSPTYEKQTRSKNFIDQIVSPWMTRMTAIGTAGIGYLHGGIHASFEHGIGAEMAAEVINHHVSKVEGMMRELKAQAVYDPQLAQALITKASAANAALISPRVRTLLDQARAISISERAQLAAKQDDRSKKPAKEYAN